MLAPASWYSIRPLSPLSCTLTIQVNKHSPIACELSPACNSYCILPFPFFSISSRTTPVLKRSDAHMHFLLLSQTLHLTISLLVSEVNICIVLVAQGGCAGVRRTARLLNHTPFTAAFQDNAAHRATHAFQNQLASVFIRQIIVASAACVGRTLVEHVVCVHVCKQFGV
jgi:hypothetical protein